MIEIQFSKARHHGGEIVFEIVAALHVDGTHLEVEGDQDFLDVRDVEVLDVERGDSVTFDADPVRWARNLPNAFRSGDLRCVVVHDSAPGATSHAAVAAEA